MKSVRVSACIWWQCCFYSHLAHSQSCRISSLIINWHVGIQSAWMENMLVGFSLAQVFKWWSWWKLNLMVVMMSDGDENQDEDKDSNDENSNTMFQLQGHRNAPGLQPRKALAAMLSKATRVLGTKRPTEIMLKPVAWYFYPCLLSHVLVPLG